MITLKVARFRAEHRDTFEVEFAQVLAVAAPTGLAKFETVAIDGTKIAANASRRFPSLPSCEFASFSARW